MTALMKLTSRLSEGSAQSKIRELLNDHTISMEVEIQQRAVEYTNLFSYDSIRPAVLERMPIPEARTIIQNTSTDSPSTERASGGRSGGPSDQDLLLDLMGVGTSGGNSGNVEQVDVMAQSPVTASSPAPPKQSNVDLLADLFGGGSPQPASSPAPSAPVSNSNNLMDLLGGETATTPQPPQSPAASNYGLDSLAGLSQNLPTSNSSLSPVGSPAAAPQSSTSASGYEAYTKNGLTVRLLPSRDRANPAIINIQVLFSNNGSQGVISDLQFQAAVPKSQRLQMNAASNTTVQANTTEKQLMRINNPQQVRKIVMCDIWFCHVEIYKPRLLSNSVYVYLTKLTGKRRMILRNMVLSPRVPSKNLSNFFLKCILYNKHISQAENIRNMWACLLSAYKSSVHITVYLFNITTLGLVLVFHSYIEKLFS